jgi:hypothetical protein
MLLLPYVVMRLNPLNLFRRTLLKDETSLLHINKKAEQALRLMVRLYNERNKMCSEISKESIFVAEKEFHKKLWANVVHTDKITGIVSDGVIEAEHIMRDVRKKLSGQAHVPQYLHDAIAYLEDVLKEAGRHLDFFGERSRMYLKQKNSFRSLVASIDEGLLAEHKHLEAMKNAFDVSRIHDMEKRVKEAEDRLRALGHTAKYVGSGAAFGALAGWALSSGGENGFPPSTPEQVRNAVWLLGIVGAAVGLCLDLRNAFAAIRGDEDAFDRGRIERDLKLRLDSPWNARK